MISDLMQVLAFAVLNEPLVFLLIVLIGAFIGCADYAKEIAIGCGALLVLGYLLLHFSITDWLVHGMLWLFAGLIGVLFGLCVQTWFLPRSAQNSDVQK